MLSISIFVPALLATSTIEQPATTPFLEAAPTTTAAPYAAFYEAAPSEPLVSPALASPVYDDMHDAPGPWYLRINAGGVTTTSSDGPSENVDFKEGWLGAVAIGRRLTDGAGPFDFSLELEGVFTKQDTDNDTHVDDVATIAPYLNGVFDFRLSDSFGLYAGAGVGAAWINVGTNTDSLNDFNSDNGAFFTWQAKAGVKWHFSPYTALTAGYRFRNIDAAKISNDIDNSSFNLQTEQHVLEVGLEFGF